MTTHQVAFYNIENLFVADGLALDPKFRPDGEYAWTPTRAEPKFRRLAAVIDRMEVDTLGLCEVGSERALHHLNVLLTMPFETAVYLRGEERRGIECAVLSRAPLAAEPTLLRVHDLDRPDIWDKPTRGILVAPLQLGGERIDVLVNHWPAPNPSNPRRPAQRLTAGRVVGAYAAARANPTVVMGDFNSNPFEPGPLAMTDGGHLFNPVLEVVRAVSESPDVDITALTDLLHTDPTRFGTFHFGGSDYWTAFDQILLSTELRPDTPGWRYQRGSLEVVRGPNLLDGPGRPIGSDVAVQIGQDTGTSDHLPVRLTLEHDGVA